MPEKPRGLKKYEDECTPSNDPRLVPCKAIYSSPVPSPLPRFRRRIQMHTPFHRFFAFLFQHHNNQLAEVNRPSLCKESTTVILGWCSAVWLSYTYKGESTSFDKHHPSESSVGVAILGSNLREYLPAAIFISIHRLYSFHLTRRQRQFVQVCREP